MNDPNIWGRYISSLVADFGVPISDAWRMTVREYWMLHGYKYTEGKNVQAAPVTKEEFEELKLHLQQKGKSV